MTTPSPAGHPTTRWRRRPYATSAARQRPSATSSPTQALARANARSPTIAHAKHLSRLFDEMMTTFRVFAGDDDVTDLLSA